jgi:hypothetical protein
MGAAAGPGWLPSAGLLAVMWDLPSSPAPGSVLDRLSVDDVRLHKPTVFPLPYSRNRHFESVVLGPLPIRKATLGELRVDGRASV